MTEISMGGTDTTVKNSQIARITLEVVKEKSGFDALEQSWNTLLEDSSASVFQTFEWQRTWWRHFGETNPSLELHLVILRDGDRVVSIAPLLIERIRSFVVLQYKRLAFIATGPSDYLNILIARGFEAACTEIIATHISGITGQFDVIDLQDIPDHSPIHSGLHAALARMGFRGERFINEYCPRTVLCESWEKTLATFKPRYRHEIQRRQKNLHKNFEVKFEVLTNEEDAVSGIDQLMAMHQTKWLQDGHPGVFGEHGIAAFHRDIALLFARRKWLYFVFLNINGERAAGVYSFSFRDTVAGYLTGNPFRSDLFKFATGRVLNSFCMQEAVKKGMTVYDFMRGTEPYKYELGAHDVPNWSVLMYNPRSILPEKRHRLNLLRLSLRRRWKRERTGLSASIQEHGIFSSATAKYFVQRVRQSTAEGIMKTKAPEKATNVRPRDLEPSNGSNE